MIRRDYILRQVEQFAIVLARISGFLKAGQWGEASAVTAGEFQRLTGLDIDTVIEQPESALLARLIESEPGLAVEWKILMVVALLKSRGDLLAGQSRRAESRESYLQGLHLLLGAFGRIDPFERPDFVPTVEAFLAALRDAPLPAATSGMLMRHYEQIGEFGRAEDALFEILDAEPANRELLDFGCLFYERLLRLNDDRLAAGNLPRPEVQSGLTELAERKARLQ